jgi:hypothetical protein
VAVSAGLESALSAISVHVPKDVDALHKIFVREAKPRERKRDMHYVTQFTPVTKFTLD